MKEKALSAIEQLPADTDFNQIIDEIRLLASLKDAEEQSKNGKTIPHNQVREELKSWAGK